MGNESTFCDNEKYDENIIDNKIDLIHDDKEMMCGNFDKTGSR